jgi:LysR family transcriptional regulator, transcription activator of glutamate synthase operon
MNVRQLEVFLAVIDGRSVTHAAEHVHLSPAAVSLQLHGLADELETELFIRSGRRLIPTPAATRLAERARSVVKQMHQLQHDFKNDSTTDGRPFHFATGITTLIYHLRRPLRLLRKRYPTNDFQISVGVTETIVAGLLESRFDLGLISLPVAEEDLNILPLFEEELLLLRPAPTRIRGGHTAPLSASELENVPFVLYPKHSNMRSIIDRFFAEIGLVPRVVMEADDTEAIKGLVEAGFGYSILPEYSLRGRARFFHIHRIGGHRLVRKQVLAMARVDYPRRLTESIANFLLTLPWTGRTPAATKSVESKSSAAHDKSLR